MRNSFLPFALPDIGANEYAHIQESLESGWITTGPKARQFETLFADSVNAKHAIAVNSCTAAMHLALEAIDLQEGDEVITTPYTFAATAEVVRYFNAKPVLVDIQPHDFNIDPTLIEEAITPKTKAIIPVHIAGLPADLDTITSIAANYNLAIIEDAAHAFPTKYKERMIGAPLMDESIPHAVCFSFYATKTLATGEGGMLCTNQDNIAERCRIMALHGISKDAWKRYSAEGSWYYEIVAPGYKYNMTDIAAGMGLAQLAKAERMRQRRHEIAATYNSAFQQTTALQIPCGAENMVGNCVYCDEDCQHQPHQHAWHLYMLRLNLDELVIDRAQLIEELKTQNIGTSVHFIPLHLHPYYRDLYGYTPQDFPIAYREFQRELSLPIYSKMSDQDVQDVISAVMDLIQQFSKPQPSTKNRAKVIAI
ncbi:MAG: DegT/DnrJ/EryC1/StrS family aminotransferase [Chloroflexota bacterium]